MFTSTKTILKIFSQTALIHANEVLRNTQDVNQLADLASKELETGKKTILSAQGDCKTLISMLKAWAVGDYKETPWTSIVLIAGAVIYFVNPLDAIPDILPAAGLIDDATVIGFVIASVKQDIAKFRSQNTGHPEFSAPTPA